MFALTGFAHQPFVVHIISYQRHLVSFDLRCGVGELLEVVVLTEDIEGVQSFEGALEAVGSLKDSMSSAEESETSSL